MLLLKIPEGEYFDDDRQQFITIKEQTVQLEHSLMSIRKWESKWHKPFLSNPNLSEEEFVDYIRFMTIGKRLPDYVYYQLVIMYSKEIGEYLQNPMTATTISKKSSRVSREIITAEIVYYWMTLFSIPFECEKWPINQLLMLISVCDIKGSPGTKMTQKEIYQQNRALNAARRMKSGRGG